MSPNAAPRDWGVTNHLGIGARIQPGASAFQEGAVARKIAVRRRAIVLRDGVEEDPRSPSKWNPRIVRENPSKNRGVPVDPVGEGTGWVGVRA